MMIYVHISYGIFPVAAQSAAVLYHVVWLFSDVRRS